MSVAWDVPIYIYTQRTYIPYPIYEMTFSFLKNVHKESLGKYLKIDFDLVYFWLI